MCKTLSPLLLILSGVSLLWLALSWVTQSPGDRYRDLEVIAAAEHIGSPPPVTLMQQAHWLVGARLARLKSLSGLLGLVAVIGVLMGWSRRQNDAWCGYRFACWTVGLLLVVGLVAGGGFSLICPWPLPLHWLQIVGVAALVYLTTFALSSGLPSMK